MLKRIRKCAARNLHLQVIHINTDRCEMHCIIGMRERRSVARIARRQYCKIAFFFYKCPYIYSRLEQYNQINYNEKKKLLFAKNNNNTVLYSPRSTYSYRPPRGAIKLYKYNNFTTRVIYFETKEES